MSQNHKNLPVTSDIKICLDDAVKIPDLFFLKQKFSAYDICGVYLNRDERSSKG